MKPYILLLNCLLILLSCSKEESKLSQTKENLFLNKGYDYYDANKVDSAYVYFNSAQELALQQKDSVTASNCLIMMGMIATNYGDHFGAQDLTLKAFSLLNKKDTAQYKSIESCLYSLGDISSRLDQYDEAIDFFKQTLPYSKTNERTIFIKNALANAYREKKDYQRAIKIQQEILRHDIDKVEYARILSNLSYTKWLNNPGYLAQTDLLKALSIRLQNNDRWGLNASYAHLADYYEKKQPDSAFLYANRMYQNANENKSPDDQLDALQKLVKLSPAIQTKDYFLRYLNLNDSIVTARNISKNQFAVIRYQVEKHKADNLFLQKKNTEKNYQLVITITGLVLLTIGGTLYYRRRKQRIALEARKAIQDNQLKTSKKVHDRVANRIYRVISEIENKDDFDKNHLLDQLDDIYNTSRDISYEITDNKQSKTFSGQLSAMLFAYATKDLTVEIVNNSDDFWLEVSENKKGEIYIVLMELMTNMKKHSQATTVSLLFQRAENSISINYHDNGVGILKDTKQGNGLRNTEIRIKNISGNITFESNDKTGLEIIISFPVN